MIDLHTHSLLSDGILLPTEMAIRAEKIGYQAIAITDHIDSSNITFIIPRIIEVCNDLNAVLDIQVIPGVELTHVPPKIIPRLVRQARDLGIRLIIVHGETIVEPVAPGTNYTSLNCDIDILAHPGLITIEDARLAFENDIFLEITSRSGHCLTNGHVVNMAKKVGAKLILNTDAHSMDDLIDCSMAKKIMLGAGLEEHDFTSLLANSKSLIERVNRRC
ncbi:MAG: histidinol phosphate phosphatase domain-containing protein [bacterium]|nr:histidinol phosphate phosphatase domain-containing protein [bacterium]